MVEINNELTYFEPFLKESKNEWEWKVAQLIPQISFGYLITYGELAEWVKKEYDLNICARNVANCRRKIYHLLRDRYNDNLLPLHRIIKKDDITVFFGPHANKIRGKDWKSYVIHWQAPRNKQLCPRIQKKHG